MMRNRFLTRNDSIPREQLSRHDGPTPHLRCLQLRHGRSEPATESAQADERSAWNGEEILLIANNFPPVYGGSAVVYHNVARAAAGRVEVLAPYVNYANGTTLIGWRDRDRQAPYRTTRLRLLRPLLWLEDTPPPLRTRIRNLIDEVIIRINVGARIAHLVLRRRYRAICLGELMASGWLIRPLVRLLKLRVIVYVHGEEITTYDSFDPQRSRCRRYLESADGIVVVSRFTQAAVHALLGRDAVRKTILISNGVDSSRFTPGPKDAGLLAKFGLAGAFTFISVCRLLEKKGVDNALRAFAMITALDAREHRLVPSCFLVVGGGPYGETLAALVRQPGISDRVVFAGPVSEENLVYFYRLGDVFVMPNRALPNGDTEGFGLVFLEANSCGLPVIAGRDGGSKEAVQDGNNGLVVDGNSVPAISTAMRQLRDDRELHDRLRRGGLAYPAKASWEHKVEEFLAFCTQPLYRSEAAESNDGGHT